ncbi:MAG: translation initiation factor IF-1 [Thermoguttaceae bacterium]|jgi:translation initiation factor IF-1
MQDRVQKAKDDALRLTGVVTEEVRGAFRVKLDDMEHVVLCHLAGKMRKNKIRVVPGDRVTIEVPADDLNRGRITFRERDYRPPQRQN